MSRVYKATGINLKSMPLGESDRVLTILTREYGLIRAVAPGARKTKSKLGGRSALFVVNQLVLSKGRSLDKISQAETLTSYPGLSQNLAKLTTSQYLAELTLYQALSDQPQDDLMDLLCWQLTQLEQAHPYQILPYFVQGIWQLLVWAGVAPQVDVCCRTHQTLSPPTDNPAWRVGFSPSEGGAVALSAWTDTHRSVPRPQSDQNWTVGESAVTYRGHAQSSPNLNWSIQLSALELDLLQQLAQSEDALAQLPLTLAPEAIEGNRTYPLSVWLAVEQALRYYAQHYLERPIRSAALIATCFPTTSSIVPSITP